MPRTLDHERLERELLVRLNITGPAPGEELARTLGVSQASFSRLVARAKDRLIVAGRARSTRYAARRTVTGLGTEEPLYEIDETGASRHAATLHPVSPEGIYVESHTSDIPTGFHRDLPFFLNELRPSGFLGRLIPAQHPELGAPRDVRHWSADHCLRYWSHHGWNLPGNFIVGERAFQLFLERTRTASEALATSQREKRYPEIAEDVLAHGLAGSSAAGEQPKFLSLLAEPPMWVQVKFSPPVGSRTGRRYADLLVSEHIAHSVLGAHSVEAAESTPLLFQERMFLEVVRFDRAGLRGRRGLLSLLALDAEFVGALRSWPESSAALLDLGIVNEEAHRTIRLLDLFGKLIGNTDRHFGNVSVLTRGARVLGIAPAYDMLPMHWAPAQGNVPDRKLELAPPMPSDADLWRAAYAAALEFWTRTADHTLVSQDFKAIAACALGELDGWRQMAERLPVPR